MVVIGFLNMQVSLLRKMKCLIGKVQSYLVWNGLNLADFPFPWFVWLIGFSIVLSQKSLRSKQIRKRKIFLKICQRTVILFLLGKIVRIEFV